MAAITLSLEVLKCLSISPDEMRRPELGSRTQHQLEALLASRGFHGTVGIRVIELPNGQGFLLGQQLIKLFVQLP